MLKIRGDRSMCVLFFGDCLYLIPNHLKVSYHDDKEGTADISSCGLVRHSVIPHSLGSSAREGAWEGVALIPAVARLSSQRDYQVPLKL